MCVSTIVKVDALTLLSSSHTQFQEEKKASCNQDSNEDANANNESIRTAHVQGT